MSRATNKTKKTALNAFFSALSLLVSSILGLIATRSILRYIGSDYNGLNSTISNFLSILMIIESGFTLAALVKLYKPYEEDDFNTINAIISKTKESLLRIGGWMLAVGVAGAAVYSLLIKTDISYLSVFVLFVFSVLSTAFQFAYVYKYRLLFQVSQSEYIIYAVNIVANTIGYLGMILLIVKTENFILARAFWTLCSIGSGFVIAYIAKRRFTFARFDEDTQSVRIDGTKELFISRVVDLFYRSLTVFYISSFAGTVYTSVYAVYNQVISLVTNYMNIFLSAPRNSLGIVINTEKERFKNILREYEYIVILSSSVIFSAAAVMTVPFVRIYTADIHDVNYIVPYIGLILVFTAILELIHIPSGQCIELIGSFKVSRNCQTVALVCLIVFSSIGAGLWGFVGVMMAKLATNIILATTEIYYTHTKIAPGALKNFLCTLLPNFIFAFGIATPEYIHLLTTEMTPMRFILYGGGILFVNTALILLFNLLFYRKNLFSVLSRIQNMIRK